VTSSEHDDQRTMVMDSLDHESPHDYYARRGHNTKLRPSERVNLAGTDTGRGHLSQSAIKTFLTCQQQYAFHYEHRLEPAIKKTPLVVGGAFAHALEHGDPDAANDYLWELADQQRERASSSPWVVAPDSDQVMLNATIAREAARCYLKQYGSHQQTREVELRARIRNPAQGGRYSLTHDLLARLDALSADFTVLYEDKLVGQIPRASLAAKVKLDRQVQIETYLVWRTTGVLVHEVRYRMTLKPGIRQRQNETFGAYLVRIADVYATRPDHYLAEEVVHPSLDDFLRLEREVWRWAESIRDSRHDGTWPRNTSACHEWGGCRFLPLCAGEPGAHHQFVEREQSSPEVAA
jgi:hypothetical protein